MPIARPQIGHNPSPIQTILFQFSTILDCEMSLQSCAIHFNPGTIRLHVGGLCPTLRYLVEGYFNQQSWSNIDFVKGVHVDITLALYLAVYIFTIGRNPQNYELQLSQIVKVLWDCL